jgi:hypothetical protein
MPYLHNFDWHYEILIFTCCFHISTPTKMIWNKSSFCTQSSLIIFNENFSYTSYILISIWKKMLAHANRQVHVTCRSWTPDNQIRHLVHVKHILGTCLNHLLDDTFGQVLSFFLWKKNPITKLVNVSSISRGYWTSMTNAGTLGRLKSPLVGLRCLQPLLSGDLPMLRLIIIFTLYFTTETTKDSKKPKFVRFWNKNLKNSNFL